MNKPNETLAIYQMCRAILRQYGRSESEITSILKDSQFYYLKFIAPEVYKALI